MMPRSVGIVGLGLMGGSLARDLAGRGVRVVAHDTRSDVVDAALSAGVIHDRLLVDPPHVEPVDLLVLATPVDVALDLLRALAPALAPSTLATDLGSTKAEICRAAAELGIRDRFVGSHPLAGDHRSGWNAARSGLYRGATVFLCKPDGGGERGVEWLAAFWTELGATPLAVDPQEHDRKMAWVSHLPQVLASALAGTLQSSGYTPDEIGPGGRDMTRLAASSPEMWAAITDANAEELDRALLAVQESLATFRDSLRQRDARAILDFFRAAQRWIS